MELLIKSNKGFSLIQVMMLASVAGILSFITVNMMQNNLKINKRLNAKVSAGMINASVIAILNNSKSWENTLSANQTMTCLEDSADCSSFGDLAEPFELRDVHDNIVKGFTSTGAACTGFVGPSVVGPNGPLPGVDHCPFGVELKFLPDCVDDACENPLVGITGVVYYNPSNRSFSFNPEKNKIDITRTALGGSFALLCNRFLGTYIHASQSCTLADIIQQP